MTPLHMSSDGDKYTAGILVGGLPPKATAMIWAELVTSVPDCLRLGTQQLILATGIMKHLQHHSTVAKTGILSTLPAAPFSLAGQCNRFPALHGASHLVHLKLPHESHVQVVHDNEHRLHIVEDELIVRVQ